MDAVRFGELNGFLGAFAKLNNALGDPQITHEYALRGVPRRGELEETLETFFNRDSLAVPPQEHSIALAELIPWEREVGEIVGRWFCDGPHGALYAGAGEAGRLRHDEEPVSSFIELLKAFAAGREARAWRITLDDRSAFYAVSYELVLFEIEERLFLLDLQLND